MAREYLPVDREQGFLLPPDMRDWLPADHLVWFVLDVVAGLDLSGFHARRRLGGAGRAGYDPAMLLAVLIYAYAWGERSSRQIERLCHSDVAFRVLTGSRTPDHATIARFRAEHADAVIGLFGQVLRLCARQGMGRFGSVALDGAKIAASAALAANREEGWLRERAARMVAEAAAVDAAEDALFDAARGDELPAAWRARGGRAARIRAALAELDAATGTGQPAAAGDNAAPAAGDNAAPAGADGDNAAPAGAETASAASAGDDGDNAASAGDDSGALAGAETASAAPAGADNAASAGADSGAAPAGGDETAVPVTGAALARRWQQRLDRARARLAAARAAQQAKIDENAARRAAAKAAGERIWGGSQPAAVDDARAVRAAAARLAELERQAQAQPPPTAQRAGTSRRPVTPPAARVNLTDPESRIMKTRSGWIQGYNAQLVVAEDYLIVAVGVSQNPVDTGQYQPMIDQAVTTVADLARHTGRPDLAAGIGCVLADAGYASHHNLTAPGPDRLIALGKRRDLEAAAAAATEPDDPGEHASPRERMRHRLTTDAGLQHYRRRGAIVEPRIGTLKDRRGLRRFARRGHDAATSELNLAAMVTNLLRLRAHTTA